jgi:hypothetical protein
LAAGLLYDLVVTAQAIPIATTSLVEVRLTLPLFGCPSAELDAAETARCTATRNIDVRPTATTPPVPPVIAAQDECRVGEPINRTVLGPPGQPGPIAPTLAEIDDRFANRPYEPLLAVAVNALGIVGLGDPALVRPGAFGPSDRGTAGWQAGWIYFVEFPVANIDDCRLVVATATATGTDLVPTATQRAIFGRPQDTQQWRWQTSGRYREPIGEFADAIIYMNVVVLAPPRGAGYAIHRLEERVAIIGALSETYLYRLGQTIQVLLRQTGAVPMLYVDRTKVLGGDRPNVGLALIWPIEVTRDLNQLFRGLRFPYFPENN